MSESLIRLSYVSASRISGDGDAHRSAINSIISKAAAKNPGLGVTGALMFNAGAFAQILEGPHEAVMALFEVIERDERHADVDLLNTEHAAERMFERWSMGYAGTDTRWMQLFGDFVAAGFDESVIGRDAIGSILLSHMLEAEPSLD